MASEPAAAVAVGAAPAASASTLPLDTALPLNATKPLDSNSTVAESAAAAATPAAAPAVAEAEDPNDRYRRAQAEESERQAAIEAAAADTRVTATLQSAAVQPSDDWKGVVNPKQAPVRLRLPRERRRRSTQMPSPPPLQDDHVAAQMEEVKRSSRKAHPGEHCQRRTSNEDLSFLVCKAALLQT